MLTPEVIEVINQIGIGSLPNEACGVIIEHPPGHYQVVRLENEAEDPTSATVMSTSGILEKISDQVLQVIQPEDMTIWHTHPSGSEGPSRKDMLCRPVDAIGARMPHLVVAVPSGLGAYY